MTDNDSIKRATLRLLRKGLVTLAEAAALADTSRQLVRYWATEADIDAPATRAAYLRRIWQATKR